MRRLIDRIDEEDRRAAWHRWSLIAIPALLFLPMLGRGFLHDDFIWIYSATLREPGDFIKVLTTTRALIFYNPVTMLSFCLTVPLWRDWAFGYGLENLLLHTLNGLLFYHFVFRLTARGRVAFLAALFFTINHTTNLWGVMWIAGRPHVLCTFFSLLLGIGLIRWYRDGRARPWWAAGMAVLFTLAVFSKEWGLTMLPWSGLLLLCARPAGWPRDKWVTLGALATGMVAIGAAYWILRSHTTAVSPFGSDDWYHMQIRVGLVANNLGRFMMRSLAIPGLVAAALMVLLPDRPRVVLTRLAVAGRVSVRQPAFWLGWLWFLVTISPYLALPVRSGLYTYMPNLGLALSLAIFCANVWEATPNLDAIRYRRRLAGLALVLLCVGVPFAYQRNWKWMRWAQLSARTLASLQQRHPTLPRGAFVYLWDGPSKKYRLRDAFGQWEGLSCALKRTYRDDSLGGAVQAADMPTHAPVYAPTYHLQFMGMEAPDVLGERPGRE